MDNRTPVQGGVERMADVSAEQQPGEWARHARMIEAVEQLRRAHEGRKQLVDDLRGTVKPRN